MIKVTIQLLRQNNTRRQGMYYYSLPDQKWLNEKYCGKLFIKNFQIIDFFYDNISFLRLIISLIGLFLKHYCKNV